MAHEEHYGNVEDGAEKDGPCDSNDAFALLHEIFTAIAANDPADSGEEDEQDAKRVACEVDAAGRYDVENKHATEEAERAGDVFNVCRLLPRNDFPGDENDGRTGFNE